MRWKHLWVTTKLNGLFAYSIWVTMHSALASQYSIALFSMVLEVLEESTVDTGMAMACRLLLKPHPLDVKSWECPSCLAVIVRRSLCLPPAPSHPLKDQRWTPIIPFSELPLQTQVHACKCNMMFVLYSEAAMVTDIWQTLCERKGKFLVHLCANRNVELLTATNQNITGKIFIHFTKGNSNDPGDGHFGADTLAARSDLVLLTSLHRWWWWWWH